MFYVVMEKAENIIILVIRCQQPQEDFPLFQFRMNAGFHFLNPRGRPRVGIEVDRTHYKSSSVKPDD